MINLKVGHMSAAVLSKLDAEGFRVNRTFDQPIPEVPDDLTDLNDEDVILLYNLFVEYDNFLAMQTTIAKIDAAEYDKQFKIVDARFLADAPKGETLAKTKARALLDDDWVASVNERDVAEGYVSLISTIQKTVSESAWVVKAELQRRKTQSFRPYTP